MRTIYFDDKDIKENKLALANQKITPLQSAFLMQYITNIEEQLQQKDDIINSIKEYCNRENVYYEKNKTKYQNEYIDMYCILELIDNKGEMKDE